MREIEKKAFIGLVQIGESCFRCAYQNTENCRWQETNCECCVEGIVNWYKTGKYCVLCGNKFFRKPRENSKSYRKRKYCCAECYKKARRQKGD